MRLEAQPQDKLKNRLIMWELLPKVSKLVHKEMKLLLDSKLRKVTMLRSFLH